MAVRKGQVFVAFAIVFASILVGAAFTTGPQFTSSTEPRTKEYFSQSLKETQEAFNSGLEENLSINRGKHGVYSFDRFLERRSISKGIKFEAYHVLVIPQNGKALFINFYDQDLNIDFKAGDWSNTTVPVNGSLQKTFNAEEVTITLKVDETNTSHNFSSTTPRILTHARMDSSGETWTDTLLG